MIAFRAALGAYRTPVSDASYERALAHLEAMARRDWAVRVLDAWARANRERAPSPYQPLDTESLWRVTVALSYERHRGRHFDGSTPDAAREAAALAVWPELPESVRAEIGERP